MVMLPIAVVVAWPASRVLRQRFASKQAIAELDVAAAMNDTERMQRMPKIKPEWMRRWERRVVGIRRLGEAKRVKANT